MKAVDRRIVRLRLAAQRITSSEFTSAAEVVRWMTAMQAQDLPGALWSVGLRLPDSTEADVNAALRDGTIVRSWPMRGTLHLVAPEDLRWMLSLSTERLVRLAAARRAALDLDERRLERARDAVIEALRGGRALRRDEMYDVFDRAGIRPDGQRGYHVLWHLAQTGTLCFGPPDGKQQTFTLFDEWITRSRDLPREEALGEFTLRYFRSHGPATIRDFAWWSSLTLADARIGLAVARGDLSTIERDGDELYFAEGADPEPGRDGIRMLPGFDEYLLGYQDRTPQLAAEHADLVVPGKNGMFFPTIVRDGEVVGTWKRALSSRGVTIVSAPFGTPGNTLRTGFDRAGRQYGRFLERKVANG